MINIRDRREEMGISQVKLSELSGVSRPTIIELEKGIYSEVKVSTLEKIAKALKCDVGDFFFLK